MQALDLRDPAKSSKAVRAAYKKIRDKIPTVRENRPMAGDIEERARLISEGTLLAAVESSVGALK